MFTGTAVWVNVHAVVFCFVVLLPLCKVEFIEESGPMFLICNIRSLVISWLFIFLCVGNWHGLHIFDKAGFSWWWPVLFGRLHLGWICFCWLQHRLDENRLSSMIAYAELHHSVYVLTMVISTKLWVVPVV